MINFEQDKKELGNLFDSLQKRTLNINDCLNSYISTTKLTPEQKAEIQEKAQKINLQSLAELQKMKQKINHDFNKQS